MSLALKWSGRTCRYLSEWRFGVLLSRGNNVSKGTDARKWRVIEESIKAAPHYWEEETVWENNSRWGWLGGLVLHYARTRVPDFRTSEFRPLWVASDHCHYFYLFWPLVYVFHLDLGNSLLTSLPAPASVATSPCKQSDLLISDLVTLLL